MKFHVDQVPIWLRHFFLLFSYLLGTILYFLCLLIHLTCRIRFEGTEHLKGRNNFIFSMWHDNIIPYFVVFLRHRSPLLWLSYPLWFMKPVFVIMKWSGLREVLPRREENAWQRAVDRVVASLREGSSTLINPDGPAGPPRVLKKGVLHMALQSGVPMVPLRIETSKAFVLKRTWEGKRIPCPFSTIRVIYGPPLQVTEENFDIAAERLVRGMNGTKL